jgi:hypothetical protein
MAKSVPGRAPTFDPTVTADQHACSIDLEGLAYWRTKLAPFLGTMAPGEILAILGRVVTLPPSPARKVAVSDLIWTVDRCACRHHVLHFARVLLAARPFEPCWGRLFVGLLESEELAARCGAPAAGFAPGVLDEVIRGSGVEAREIAGGIRSFPAA